MAVVAPEERSAAASVTNVPRSLAGAITPVIARMMLTHSSFEWPLVCAGTAKVLYDLMLFYRFRSLSPAS
jgi:hypothetical protein